jgi:hypothetical protein
MRLAHPAGALLWAGQEAQMAAFSGRCASPFGAQRKEIY